MKHMGFGLYNILLGLIESESFLGTWHGVGVLVSGTRGSW